MQIRFTLSLILTIGAFVLTLYLFVVTIAFRDKLEPETYLGCGTTNNVSPITEKTELNHPGEKIFKANCKACHRINQKLVGPALAGVTDRYDSLWLVSWIRNSSKMIKEGDPIAVALFKEYNQTQMTSFTSFTDEELKSLLEYLRIASQPEPMPMPVTGRFGV